MQFLRRIIKCSEGEGLRVDARNVTLVTEEMYANALKQQGLKMPK